ncbi:hypothetical protein LSTR_LSTR015930 [Laodelphax striatellus]|uniref:Uncharacterized protein n=1 Tax=Laodelphax striatellus TaxID=195883 RepID=A0A482WUK3_LAOST|nr:hypothetical protein LSTR_LSTR015930 [Laodelphax striatellus]
MKRAHARCSECGPSFCHSLTIFTCDFSNRSTLLLAGRRKRRVYRQKTHVLNTWCGGGMPVNNAIMPLLVTMVTILLILNVGGCLGEFSQNCHFKF